VTAGRRIARRGGTIAAIAECPEGHGSDVFDRWMNEATSVEEIFERIRAEFVMEDTRPTSSRERSPGPSVPSLGIASRTGAVVLHDPLAGAGI